MEKWMLRPLIKQNLSFPCTQDTNSPVSSPSVCRHAAGRGYRSVNYHSNHLSALSF